MTVDVAVTSDSLCVLTRQYSSSQKVADDLCDVLAKAEEAATPKLRDKRSNDFVKKVNKQAGSAFTQEEAATLVRLAREIATG